MPIKPFEAGIRKNGGAKDIKRVLHLGLLFQIFIIMTTHLKIFYTLRDLGCFVQSDNTVMITALLDEPQIFQKQKHQVAPQRLRSSIFKVSK